MNDRDESTDVWAEVVAAVEFLRDGPRLGLTVWEVLDEATRCWLLSEYESPAAGSAWTDPDSLRSGVEMLFRHLGPVGGYGAERLGAVLTSALRAWLEVARRDHNDGMAFHSRTLAIFERTNWPYEE